MTRKMIIDTDTASDDAVAIMMALQTPDIEVEAITIVSGNMPVAQGSNNARYVVELCGKSTPVYHGAEKPLMRETYHAHWFHGVDGMGGMGYTATSPPAAGSAIDVLVDTIRANPGIILVTLGPLTNVALAVSKAPEIVKDVSRCVVMGGAANVVGNVTPAAEYNIWCDPEAARIVFRSGLPVEMVGWELCRGDANLDDEEMRYCKEAINTPLAHMTIDSNFSAIEANRNWLGDPGLGLPDPVAMAIAIDPAICTRKSKHYVAVECDGTYTRGMTVVDQLGSAGRDVRNSMASVPMWAEIVNKGEPFITVCWEIDAQRWKDLLYKTMR
jgi:purine nucleosidase